MESDLLGQKRSQCLHADSLICFEGSQLCVVTTPLLAIFSNQELVYKHAQNHESATFMALSPTQVGGSSPFRSCMKRNDTFGPYNFASRKSSGK